MVDEYAGQLFADRLVDQHRRDRAVDPARQAADHLAVADLGADLGDLGVAERAHRPVAGTAANVPREIGEQLAAVGRVHDLGMEHHRIEAALLVGRDRVGRAFRLRDDREAVGQLLDPVAVAHPHLVGFADAPQPVEQGAVIDHLDEGAAEFAVVGRRDHSAKLVRHRLLAVADRQDRQAGIEEVLRRARAVFPHHRRRTARQDDPLGLQPLERFVGGIERRDLAIDAGLAHAARDQLRHLAAEIDDEDGFVGLNRHGGALRSGASAVKLHPGGTWCGQSRSPD